MNILFISSMRGGPWGGSEVLWTSAAARAIANGHRVALSVFDWPEPAQQIRELAQGALLIPRPLRPSRFAGMFIPPRWLSRFAEFNPDAICLSQGGAYECVGRRSTRPILNSLLNSRARVVNILQYNSDTTLAPRTRSLAKALFDRCDVNAFVAQRSVEQAARAVGSVIPRAIVVRNPVNLADTSALPLTSSTTLRLACVARLDSRIKGQATLINLLAASNWASRDWSLSLAGEGPDRDQLLQLIRARNLATRVRLVGQVQGLRAFWKDHDALVLASTAEGTPLSMVEAMLLGRPCVVTDVGGCAEWVRDGLDGFIARTPNQTDLAAALENLWASRTSPSISAMGDRARARAVELHDPDPAGSLLHLLTGKTAPAEPR